MYGPLHTYPPYTHTVHVSSSGSNWPIHSVWAVYGPVRTLPCAVSLELWLSLVVWPYGPSQLTGSDRLHTLFSVMTMLLDDGR